MKTTKKIIGLIFWILLSMSAGFIGSRYMPGEWYAQLNKPSFNPPNTVFGPVWTTLYILMGISAWLVWKSDNIRKTSFALLLFIIQLILNALWSYLFFGIQQISYAMIDIIVLWCFILFTIIHFWKHSKLAGVLLVPYILWVSFASVLNFALMRLN